MPILRQSNVSFLAASIFLMAVLWTNAAIAKPKPMKEDPIRAADNAWTLSFGGLHFDYVEKDDNNETIDSELGWMPKISTGVSLLTNERKNAFFSSMYYALDGSVAFGSADYDGALMDGTPHQGTTDEIIFTIDGRIGKGFNLHKQFMLIPFIEFGYRNWDRDLHSYSENYHHFDAMGGLLAQYAPVSKLVLSFTGAWGSTFAAGMTATNPTMDFDLDSAGIWKIGGKLGYTFTSKWEILAGIDYKQFSYGKSQLVFNTEDNLYYYEPDSTTKELSTNIGLAYHF